MIIQALEWGSNTGKRYKGVALVHDVSELHELVNRRCPGYRYFDRTGGSVTIPDRLPADQTGWISLTWLRLSGKNGKRGSTIPVRLRPADEGMRFFCFSWKGEYPGYLYGNGALVVHNTREDAFALLSRHVLLEGDMDRYNKVLEAQAAPCMQLSLKTPNIERTEFETPGIVAMNLVTALVGGDVWKGG